MSGWVAGSIVVGAAATAYSAHKSASAAKDAAASQSASAQAGIDEQRSQFDKVQQLLSPYVNAGKGSLAGQQDLLGLNGATQQQAAISGIQSSPMFGAMAQQGEDAILQNASATGGLRGGNTQGALAQFRPALLNSLIDQQYQRLGGLTTTGQNSAAGVGVAGLQTGNAVSGLLQQQGAAQAGVALAGGRATQQTVNGLTNAFGQAQGAGLFNASPGYNQWVSNNAGVLDSTGLTPSELATF